MNCSEFEASWHGLISNSVDASKRGAMAAHARVCDNCGKRWKTQQEVDDTLQRLVDSIPLPATVAQDAAEHAYQTRYGAAIDFGKSEVENVQRTAGVLWPRNVAILIAVAAALFGYLLGAGQSRPNPLQQLYNAQLAYGGGRGGNPHEMMLVAQMAGMGGAGGGYLPAVTSTAQVICLATLLIWATRSRLWQRVFPAKLPAGLHIARWLGLIAALIGLAKSIGWAYGQFTLRSMQGNGGRTMRSDANWIANTMTLVDQLWGIAFWLTIVVLAITVAEQLVQGVVAGNQEQRPDSARGR